MSKVLIYRMVLLMLFARCVGRYLPTLSFGLVVVVHLLFGTIPSVTRASVGEWGLSRTKVCSGAVDVLRVAISGSRQRIERGRDLR